MVKKVTKSDASAVDSVFGSAEVLPAAKPKSKKGDKERVPMGTPKTSFQAYIAMMLVVDALESIKDQYDQEFKQGEAYKHFHKTLCSTGQKPEAFEGFEGDATAQFQFRRKSSFKPEQTYGDSTLGEKLTEYNVPFEKEESVPERFVINPLILEDQSKLIELSKAIQKLGLDFQVIQKQQPVFKYVITDDAYAAVAKIKDNTDRLEILRALSTPAVAQPKLGGQDEKSVECLEKALDIIKANKILDLSLTVPKKKKSSYPKD